MGGLAKKLLASAGGEEKLYVDDVFSTYLRTGTGADTTVNTNIDMTKGYMLWTKGRSGATDHAIYDSARGVTLDLASNTTAAQTTQSTGLISVSATGHTIGSLAKMNTSGATYVDYVFRKAPKFFDVVTYTTVAGAMTIPHSLGQEVGMWVIKATNAVDSWWVHHRSIPTSLLRLNGTSAVEPSFSTATSTNITISNGVFAAGTQIVIYLFAHDTSADGIIQCGSFNYQTFPHTVELGYEPQWLMVKQYDGTGDWIMFDNMRGLTANGGGGNGKRLLANTSGAETTTDNLYYGSATGFNLNLPTYGNYIYLAIRRPNKPPTTGTQVYNASTAAANTAINVGFPPDLWLGLNRSGDGGAGNMMLMADRLRGNRSFLATASSNAEVIPSADYIWWDRQNSFTNSYQGGTRGDNFFKRASGFMDVVCYTGDATASRTVTHNLTAIPELMIVKARSGSGNWYVWYSPDGTAILNSTGQGYANDRTTFGAVPTASVFTCDNADVYDINASGVTYVAYLFASLPGISKCGSYIGNGTTQTINCGFTTGARFILVKRTDSTDDWYVWDTTRGIVADNDPHLSLNTTAAEVTTDDSVDPESSGFIVNQNTTTNINVNGGSYIFLAIA